MAIDRKDGVRVVNVGDLLAEDLTIPPYQRPYSWEPVTAVQLLDDIREAFGPDGGTGGRVKAASGSYVLGAVILHLEYGDEADSRCRRAAEASDPHHVA